MTYEVYCYGILAARPVSEAAWRRVVTKLNMPGGVYPYARGSRIGKRPEIEVIYNGKTLFYQSPEK